MNAAFYYLDFFIKSFDVQSKTSRKSFWYPFLINAIIVACLICLGLWIVPSGKPREIFIGIDGTLVILLLIPSVTSIARLLNDIIISRRRMLLMLIPVAGYIAVLVLCARPSEYGTQEELSHYKKGQLYEAVKKFTGSAMTIYPFIYFLYSIFRIIMTGTSRGLAISGSLCAINILICIFTAIELKTSKAKRFLLIWKAIKTLTVIASAIVSIIFYHESANIVDALFIVYLCFYVVIGPFVLIGNILKLFKPASQNNTT